MKTTDQEILDLIHKRKSPLAFADQTVKREDLMQLFEAARWAASAFNEQPWRFIYAIKAENREAYSKIEELLFEANRSWAKEAPVLILVVAKRTFTLNELENKTNLYDTGQAMGVLSVQATAKGLALHQLGGFDHLKASEVFNLGSDYLPIAVVALGYEGDKNTLPEALKTRSAKSRTRKPIEEIAFDGKFSEIKEIAAVK